MARTGSADSATRRTGSGRLGGRTAAALLLAGLVAAAPAGPPAAAAGGPFSGHYTGTYAYPSFSGTGTATFIGASSITSRFHCGSGSCLGTATLTSMAHRGDALLLSLWCQKPCPTAKRYHYAVTRGTGAFARAMGGGTATYLLHGTSTGTVTAVFTGTLTF